MNNHFCFMIRFIMEDYNGIEEELLNVLSKDISKHFQCNTITLFSSEQYWKFPEERAIIYGIILTPCIEIKELISHYPISWEYTKGGAYSVELKKRYIDEDAIWSKNCHPLEIFLLPKVNWVHIYTWPN